ncbi:hypothetical protein [Bacillus sp. SM2101]|uniref:hypothetical protein n=1 Tax=Bacillus sp. SM2101 TaxID=2805366 RepID=UPI001BDECF60|nr:hypothetical protein [Bacillus sp. SM2101]
MKMELSIAEQQYVNNVLDELKRYQISSKERSRIKEQLLEHIQEAREHGDDAISELGDPATFITDFLEVNGIDPAAGLKQIQQSKPKKGMLFPIGVLTLIVTYLCTQFIFSMSLTRAFDPTYSNDTFNYNILYQISDNTWWNAMLMVFSLAISLLVSLLVVVYLRKVRYKR